ncbi:MAG: hypothetical protein RRB13_00735 [bacterium]|nr:hypothetical protein [bacterium]
MNPALALFVTSHGFGHAARSAAVLEALFPLLEGWNFEIFTETPLSFFQASLSRDFGYHRTQTDLGLVQTSALEGDLDATLRKLSAELPYRPGSVKELAQTCQNLNVKAIISDISPLGLLVASQLKAPSFLLENFTWDWIYRRIPGYPTDFNEFADYLEDLFGLARWRIQAFPACEADQGDFTSRPIARSPRTPAEVTRAHLGLQRDQKLILLTLGGIEGQVLAPPRGYEQQPWLFVSPTGSGATSLQGNWLQLGDVEGYFHPDLMEAADLVVCKLGYSTLAEAWQSGTPVLYLSRPDFPESPVLEAFCRSELASQPLTREALSNGNWLALVEKMLHDHPKGPNKPSGAIQTAQWIAEQLR